MRCARIAAALASALLAALFTTVVGLPAAGADVAAAPGGSLQLLSQSPYVTTASPRFDLEVRTTTSVPAARKSLQLTLYDRLLTRTGFEAALANPTGGVLERLAPVALSSLSPGPNGGSLLSLPVETTAPGGGAAPALHLDCSADCPGVYPLAVELVGPGGELGRFTTFVTFAGGAAADPLHVAVVLPFGAPVRLTGRTDPSESFWPLPSSTVSRLRGLAQVLRAAPVPVTLDVVPATLQALAADRSPAARAALDELGPLDQPAGLRQFPAPSYVPIDLNALAGSGLGGEVKAQVGKGSAVLSGVLPPARGTWVVDGGVGTGLARGLPLVGATQVVVPEGRLAASGTNTWTQTFQLSFGRGADVTAAAADTELTNQFAAHPGDPVLAANQLLADLAFVFFEDPGESGRGVVAAPPAGWTAGPAFVRALLAGLGGNPVVTPVTLDTFFSSVPTGTNGAPSTRRLSSGGTGPVLPVPLRQAIVTARLRLSSFDSAVVGAPVLLSQFDNLLLASESSERSPTGQSAGVAAFERSLGAQLSLLQLATERTITLTSRTGEIPVTILSSAPYDVQGTLTLVSDKLQFAGSSGHSSFAFTADHASNSVRVQVTARTSGDLPLDVTFSAPRGGLVIAHGSLTVRSTATSLVGIVLTLVAAVVLLAWWARTWRKGRRARHAARARPTGADGGAPPSPVSAGAGARSGGGDGGG